MLVDARRAERAGGAGGRAFVGAKLFQQPTHHRAAYRRASLVIKRQRRGGGGAQLEVVRREGHRVDLSFHAAHERITVAVIVATQASILVRCQANSWIYAAMPTRVPRLKHKVVPHYRAKSTNTCTGRVAQCAAYRVWVIR